MAVGMPVKGRKVVVVGANASGIALTKFLIKKGALVSLADAQPAEQLLPLLQEKIDTSKFTLEAGDLQPRILEGAGLVILTPGMIPDSKFLEAARAAGIQIISELEFASLYIEETLIAVGGTKGKTTTTAMLTRLFEIDGKKAFSNVTQPLADYLNTSKPADFVVAATNSFQLEGVSTFKPRLVVLLNLHEDHVNRYPNPESYLAANREILKNADDSTIVVLNSECPNLSTIAQQVRGRSYFFGHRELPEGFEGAWCVKTEMFLKMNGELHSFDLKNLRVRGTHMREDLMAASISAVAMGAKPASIQTLIESFSALPSRMEFTKRLNAVAFYNDSCATTPSAVIKSLQSFNEPVILIMGGRDKSADYSPLIPHVRHRVKNLILVGEAKEKVNRALGDYTETFLVGTLEEAVLMAYQKSRSGDIVLLSPGCDSRDAYINHEDRGEHFKKLITQLAAPRRIAYI